MYPKVEPGIRDHTEQMRHNSGAMEVTEMAYRGEGEHDAE